MVLTIDLPDDVEQRIRAQNPGLESQAREIILVDLYRRGQLTHHALSQALRLDRFETEEVLHKHKVTEDLGTLEEHLAEVRAVQELRTSGC
jgi:hypothetical protein